MARAGFWPIGGYTISFRTDGRWYADDEVIANARIARLFSQHVQADDGDGWVIDLGVDRQRVEVEDTALVVVAVGEAGGSDTNHALSVRTNDAVTSELDPATLEIGSDNVLYCTVERGGRGRIRARFLRPAYYELARRVVDSPDGPLLAIGDARHPIRGSVG